MSAIGVIDSKQRPLQSQAEEEIMHSRIERAIQGCPHFSFIARIAPEMNLSSSISEKIILIQEFLEYSRSMRYRFGTSCENYLFYSWKSIGYLIPEKFCKNPSYEKVQLAVSNWQKTLKSLSNLHPVSDYSSIFLVKLQNNGREALRLFNLDLVDPGVIDGAILFFLQKKDLSACFALKRYSNYSKQSEYFFTQLIDFIIRLENKELCGWLIDTRQY